jgi:hypothetical protein
VSVDNLHFFFFLFQSEVIFCARLKARPSFFKNVALLPWGETDKEVNYYVTWCVLLFIYFFFVVLGLELWAYTLSHSTSPIFVKGFFQDRVL